MKKTAALLSAVLLLLSSWTFTALGRHFVFSVENGRLDSTHRKRGNKFYTEIPKNL